MSASAADTAAAGHDDLVLLRGVVANAATLAAMSLRAVFGMLVARWHGGAALGLYALAAAWIDLSSNAGVLGLDSGAMVHTARRRAAGGTNPAGILARALRVALTASGVLAAVVLLVAAARAGGLFSGADGQEPFLAVMALALPALATAKISSGVSRGLGIVHNDLYAHGVVGTGVMLVTFLAATAAGFGPLSAAIAFTLGAFSAAWVAWRSLVSQGRVVRASTVAGDADLAPGLVRDSLPIAGAGLLNLLTTRLDLLLLGLYVGAAPGLTPLTFGIYCAAAEIAGGLRKIRPIFGLAFGPIAASSTGAADTLALRRHMGQVGRWVISLVGPAVVLAVVAGEPAMSLYGPGFKAGAGWLAILTTAAAAHALLGLLETLLMVRRPALNLINAIAALGLQVVFSFALIPRWGPLGAALAMLSAYVIQAILRLVEIRLLEGWWWPWSSIRRPVFALVCAGAAAVPARAIFGAAGAWAAPVTFLIVYAAVWLAMGLEADDYRLLNRRRGRVGVSPGAYLGSL